MNTSKPKDTICGAGIVGFVFNKDSSEAVFSPNNHQLLIVACGDKRDCGMWEICATLEQHDQSVSAIAWHGATDRILSCAQDRSAFVWCRDGKKGTWRPQIVMLDSGVKRGLTSCAWSPSGSKIYVGSAAANIAVGCFDAENEWWICRLLLGHTSTVTALAPHPLDDALLVSGGTDGKLMITSTFMKKLDVRKTNSFGHVYYEKQFGAWVHAVAWAPSGKHIAVATHDSRVHVVSASSPELFTQNSEALTLRTINLQILPLKALVFLAEDKIVGGGFDYYPVLFTQKNGEEWKLTGKWTINRAKGMKTAQQIAREKFQNEARIGQAEMTDEVQTRHKNTINSVVVISHGGDTEVKIDEPIFATASLDGRVEMWTVGDMTAVS